MKNKNLRKKQVRRRKVAQIARYSRMYTTTNRTKSMPEFDKKDLVCVKINGENHYMQKAKPWKNQEWLKPYKLHKRIRGIKWVYDKESKLYVKTYVDIKSEYPDYSKYNNSLWKNLGNAAKMKAYEDLKMKRWYKNNPKPSNEDLFSKELTTDWEKARDEELIRVRDLIVSMFDKLCVVAKKVDKTSQRLIATTIGKIKDIDQKGHNVKYPDLKKTDDLYVKAKILAITAMEKDPNIVDCSLLNHTKDQDRLLLQRSDLEKEKAKLKAA